MQRSRQSHRQTTRSDARQARALAAACGLLLAGNVFAADISWTGAPATPLPFGTGSNWAGGVAPGAGDNGFINNGGIATVAAPFAGTVTDLRLGTGAGDSGSITQTGGTLTATGNMAFGSGTGGAGSLNISGGVLNVGSGFVGELSIGQNGAGTANISGGAINTVNMIVGRIPGGSGTVVQTGGAVNVSRNLVMFERAPDFVPGPASPDFWTMSAGSITVGNEMYIGAHGPATFDLSGTGSISIVGTLHIAASGGFSDPPAGVGTLNMSSGTINVTGANAFFVVADHGDGTFNFSGGSITTKFYNIGQNFELGFSTRGVVNHTGGTATAEYAWVVGEESRSENLYDLSGGSVTVVGIDVLNPGNLNIASGPGSRGTLQIRGTGVANVANSAIVGGANLTNGSLTISGSGSLALGTNGSGNGQLIIGDIGTGKFQISGGEVSSDFITLGQNPSALGTGTQSGGTVLARANMSIGETSTNANIYDISAGVLNVNGTLYVASNGTGTLRVGGTGAVTALTGMESSSAGTGVVTVTGGSLTAASFNNRGTYTQSGGVASLGAVTDSGSISVTGGTLTAKSIAQTTLAISTVGQVNISPDGTVAGTSNVKALNIAGGATPTGKLNLSNNALVVDYTSPDPSPLATIAAQIRSAYAAGAWSGNGITSSLANSNNFAVGYAEASALTTIPAIFGTVDADAVLVRYTRYGDADLSGTVGLDDFNRLASNFNTAGKGWSDGNFNYDVAGNVNLDDFNLLAGNFNLSAGPDGVVDPEDWAALAAAIPEPTALLSGLVVSAAMLTRRHRRAR